MFTSTAEGPTSIIKRPVKARGIRRMRALMVLAAVAALAASPAVPAAAAAGHQPSVPSGHATSAVWSGYVDTGRHFRFVSVEFTAPSVNCAQSPPGSSGWAQVMAGAGLGGWTSGGNNSEQVGFAAGCHTHPNGQYLPYTPYVWYYTRGTGQLNANIGPVQSGDTLKASVSYDSAAAQYTLSLTDLTQPSLVFSKTFTSGQCASDCNNKSAEVITQVFDGVLNGFNLADFGPIGYTSAKVTSTSGHKGTLAGNSQWNSTRVSMVNPATGDTMATAGRLHNGTAYQESWHATN